MRCPVGIGQRWRNPGTGRVRVTSAASQGSARQVAVFLQIAAAKRAAQAWIGDAEYRSHTR